MIKVQYSFDRLGYAIYIYQGNREYREIKQADGKWKQVKEGEAVEPTLYIEDIQELANAIAEAGVKAPSDHKLEGILEAQKQHLEDMRKLVFMEPIHLQAVSEQRPHSGLTNAPGHNKPTLSTRKDIA